jgi:hypothetical protein
MCERLDGCGGPLSRAIRSAWSSSLVMDAGVVCADVPWCPELSRCVVPPSEQRDEKECDIVMKADWISGLTASAAAAFAAACERFVPPVGDGAQAAAVRALGAVRERREKDEGGVEAGRAGVSGTAVDAATEGGRELDVLGGVIKCGSS